MGERKTWIVPLPWCGAYMVIAKSSDGKWTADGKRVRFFDTMRRDHHDKMRARVFAIGPFAIWFARLETP